MNNVKSQPSLARTILKPLASLRLTVALLALAVLLIFFGTWAQRLNDIWHVQRTYFHSWFVWSNFGIISPSLSRIPLPLVGGYTLILLILVNLVAAHASRFKATWWDLVLIPLLGVMVVYPQALLSWLPPQWLSHSLGGVPTAMVVAFIPLLAAMAAIVAVLHKKRTGIILIHTALIVLLGGEAVTSLFAVESQMVIDEGQTTNYSFDTREAELAVVDASATDVDKVVAISRKRLRSGGVISDPALPFTIKVDAYYKNSDLIGPFQAAQKKITNPATEGEFAKMAVAVEATPTAGVGDEASRVDTPAGYVTLTKGEQNLGTYLLSAGLRGSQTVNVDGKKYDIALRFRRHYYPFSLHLTDFSFERYPGTNEPRNYSSDVILTDPARNESRNVRIWMNHPLRFAGLTFYQSSFNRDTERATVLQVVSNPGIAMPYIACAMGGVGLLIHFGIVLINFIGRTEASGPYRRTTPPPLPSRRGSKRKDRGSAGYTLEPRSPIANWWFPVVMLLVFGGYLGAHLRVPPNADAYDLNAFGQIPISFDGRQQPLQSLAENSLKSFSGRSVLKVEKENPSTFAKMMGMTTSSRPATQWLIDVWTRNEQAEDYRIFRVDDPGVKNLFAPATDVQAFLDRRMFSVAEIKAGGKRMEEQFQRLSTVPKKNWDAFQRQLAELGENLQKYQQIEHFGELLAVPPAQPGGDWRQLGEVVHAQSMGAEPDPAAEGFKAVLRAYANQQPMDFNSATKAYLSRIESMMPAVATRVQSEVTFRRVDPFTQLVALYLTVFLLVIFSWLGWRGPLYRAAWSILALAIFVHAIALVWRIYLSGRPPVTNLYSAAIFIPFGTAILAACLELFFRYGIGLITAGAIGCVSLLVAININSGDNMAVLQAVLDTNFWLATHVVIITLGYAATYLAGFLAIGYVLAGVFTKALDPNRGDVAKALARMVYAILCFAILFSFVGTVLGGIWADQSWGRFWGWDPKENGAALIVLWNAIVLHARWGGIARQRGIMLLAIFGNIVTTWSFFGTNMLGIGLHAYGFMDKAFLWISGFCLAWLALIAVGLLPQGMWASFSDAVAKKPGGFTVTRKAGGSAP